MGNALTKYILSTFPKIKRLVIFSRDEQKQFQMSQKYPESKFPCIRFFIGDVRDYDRLSRAIKDIDFVIHAAAMKHVHIAEYNPDECIKTNIGGAENVIRACLENNVADVVALSTDKACAPINLYGATKLTSDKLFIAANNIKGSKNIRFSVVRYGNVMGSNGSVIPFFKDKSKTGVLPITDPKMTRFNISIEDGVKMIMNAFENAWGGEIFIPKIPSYKIMDIANTICEKCEKKIIGIRPGEKIHEEMITPSDSYNSYDLGKFYVILPTNPTWNLNDYLKKYNGKKLKEGFSYNSGTNTEWVSIRDLKNLIKTLDQ